MISVVRAFVARDWRVATSHRVPFLVEGVGILFALLEVAYIGKIVEPGAVDGGYFAFVVSGLVLTGLLAAGLVTLAGAVRQEQVQGTLEGVVASGLPRGTLVIGMAAYPFLAAAVRAVFLIGLAAFMGADAAPDANWWLAAAALVLSSVAFVGVGLLASAFVLTFRQGAAGLSWILTLLVFGAGVGFPRTLLPEWLQGLGELSPLTQGLSVVRAAVFEGATWASTASQLAILLVGAITWCVVAMIAVRGALARALHRGTLAQY